MKFSHTVHFTHFTRSPFTGSPIIVYCTSIVDVPQIIFSLSSSLWFTSAPINAVDGWSRGNLFLHLQRLNTATEKKSIIQQKHAVCWSSNTPTPIFHSHGRYGCLVDSQCAYRIVIQLLQAVDLYSTPGRIHAHPSTQFGSYHYFSS